MSSCRRVCVPRHPFARNVRNIAHVEQTGREGGNWKTRVLTCNWKVVPWDAAEASRSNVEIPRIRCRPFCDSQQGKHRRNVGSVLKAAVTAWTRRAARRPLENVRSGAKMSLTLGDDVGRATTASTPLATPYWFLRGERRAHPRVHSMISRGLVAPPGNRTREASQPAEPRPKSSLGDLIFQSGRDRDHIAGNLETRRTENIDTPRTRVIGIQRPVFHSRKERANLLKFLWRKGANESRGLLSR